MIRSMLLLCLACYIFSSCGLSKHGIKEAWIFTEEKFRGNIQVDENGNPLTKAVVVETSIFLESKTQDTPTWTSANIDGKIYKVVETTLVTSPVIVGKNKNDESPVIIAAAKEHFLFRLVLESFDPLQADKDIEGITLLGGSSEKPVYFNIKKKATALLPQMVP